METPIAPITFATFVTEARKTRKAVTAVEKRRIKIRKLDKIDSHWSGLEAKELMDPDNIHFKARETYVANFLDRLREFLNTDAEMSPLSAIQRMYTMWDEEVGQK